MSAVRARQRPPSPLCLTLPIPSGMIAASRVPAESSATCPSPLPRRVAPPLPHPCFLALPGSRKRPRARAGRRTSSASSRARSWPTPERLPQRRPARPATATGSRRSTTTSRRASTRRAAAITGKRDDHLPQQLARPADLPVAAARPEHLPPRLASPNCTRDRAPADDDQPWRRCAAPAAARPSRAASRSPPCATPRAARCRFTVVDTLMRVDLPQPLAPRRPASAFRSTGATMIENKVVGGRDGYECFTEPGRGRQLHLPDRAVVPAPGAPIPTTRAGRTRQFLGRGEFTLEFGDYDVALTVPADHIVAATGELQNPDAVLTAAQRERLAAGADRERAGLHRHARRGAGRRTGRKADGEKTWLFKAENVRDFALASSPQVHLGRAWACARTAPSSRWSWRCPSIPKEGNPLWDAYSTQAITHTIDAYSHVHLRLSLSDGAVGERPGRRHGIPDDLLQRPAPGEGQEDGDLPIPSAPSTA